MTDVNAFNKALDFHIKKAIPKVTNDMVVLTVRFTYDIIFRSWPIDTGWSLANHRISITGTPITRLEPTKRPKGKGILVSKAQSNREAQLAKLDRVQPGKKRTILIGNSVPYAPDVGGKGSGLGRAIYASAAAEGAKRAKFFLGRS